MVYYEQNLKYMEYLHMEVVKQKIDACSGIEVLLNNL